MRLSDEQLQFFRDNGYVAGVRVLNNAQIDALCDELERFFDPSMRAASCGTSITRTSRPIRIRCCFMPWAPGGSGEAFHDVLWNPAFTVPASQLLAAVGASSESAVPVRFWHDQLFCKPARHGGVVAWHQDYSYWTRTEPMQHLTCWIGLDDSTIDNGCLHYVPGSHKWNLLPITGLAGDMDAIKDVLNDEQWEQFQRPGRRSN